MDRLDKTKGHIIHYGLRKGRSGRRIPKSGELDTTSVKIHSSDIYVFDINIYIEDSMSYLINMYKRAGPPKDQ